MGLRSQRAKRSSMVAVPFEKAVLEVWFMTNGRKSEMPLQASGSLHCPSQAVDGDARALSGDLYEVLVWRAVVAHHHGEACHALPTMRQLEPPM